MSDVPRRPGDTPLTEGGPRATPRTTPETGTGADSPPAVRSSRSADTAPPRSADTADTAGSGRPGTPTTESGTHTSVAPAETDIQTGTHTGDTDVHTGTHTRVGTGDTGIHEGDHAHEDTRTPAHAGHDGGLGAEHHLLPHDHTDKFAAQLKHAVAGFVDTPRDAVREADRVLEELTQRFTDAVTERRRTLRRSWQTSGTAGPGDGQDAAATDTEQLRLALRDYRELAERLLRV